MISVNITSIAMETTEVSQENSEFNELISIILEIKTQSPEKTEREIETLMEQKMTISKNRGVGDIWNALTDSEKKLLIRYSFDALKVNKAKNIATAQTEKNIWTKWSGR